MTATPDAEPVASLSFVRPSVGDVDEALRLLAGAAVEQGYAHETLPAALVDREQRFPTGLPTPLPCAIPHADAKHVRRPGIGLLAAAEPLRFGEMGTPDRHVDARLVVLLLVDDPSRQVALLGRVVKALQRPDLEQALFDGLEGPDDLAARFARAMEP